MELGSVPYLVPVWLSLIAVVAVVAYNLRRRSKPCALPLAVMGGLIGVWCLAFSVELLSSDLRTMRIIEQFEFVEGGLGAAVLWYVLEYIQPGRRLSKRQLLILFAAPVIIFLLSLTNFAHQLFFRGPFVAHLGPLSLLGYESRIMAWLGGTVGIAFYLAAVSILISHIMRMPPIYRGQSWWTVGALIFPGVIGLIFLFEIVPYYLGDFLVTGFALGMILLHWIAHQAGTAELMPFAHDLLYRQIDQIAVVLDRNMRIIEINPAGQRVFGEAARWVIGEPLERLLPGVTLPCVPNHDPSGYIPIGERVFLTNCSPIQDIQGNAYGWLVLFYDTTEQIQLHEALTSSEARYRGLAEAANDGIVIIQDGKLVYANRRCFEIGGYSQEELIGQDFLRFLRPDDHEQIMRAYLRRLSGSTTGGLVESALLTKDGSWRNLEYNTGLIEYQGRPAVVAYLRDITSRKEIEQQLRDSEELYRSIVTVSPDDISITDLDGRIQLVSPAGLRMFGYAAGDALEGKSLAEFVVPEDRARFIRDVALLAQGPELGILEYHGLRKDGTLFEFEINGGVLRDGAGKPKSLVFVVRDITERRRIEASERQRVQELEVLRATLQDISAELELPRLLKAIVERMVGLMNVRDSELAMYHEDARQLEIVVSYLKERDYTGTIMQLGEGCMGMVAQTRQSMVIDDYAEWEGRSPQYLASHTSIVAVPLVSGARLLGVLAVGDEADRRKFNHRDMQLLEMFAQQAVIAIQNAELFSEVQRLATIDPLTGILNRRSFFERAIQEFTRSRRYHTPLSLVMLDLDHFKKINDTFGHLIGDKALSEISGTCAAQIRTSDFVGRYGGEEFVVLLPETSLEGALCIAQRLCDTIRDVTIESKQGLVKVTASVGVAELMEDYANLDALLEHADAALYRAKQAGRNRVSV